MIWYGILLAILCILVLMIWFNIGSDKIKAIIAAATGVVAAFGDKIADALDWFGSLF